MSPRRRASHAGSRQLSACKRERAWFASRSLATFPASRCARQNSNLGRGLYRSGIAHNGIAPACRLMSAASAARRFVGMLPRNHARIAPLVIPFLLRASLVRYQDINPPPPSPRRCSTGASSLLVTLKTTGWHPGTRYSPRCAAPGPRVRPHLPLPRNPPTRCSGAFLTLRHFPPAPPPLLPGHPRLR